MPRESDPIFVFDSPTMMPLNPPPCGISDIASISSSGSLYSMEHQPQHQEHVVPKKSTLDQVESYPDKPTSTQSTEAEEFEKMDVPINTRSGMMLKEENSGLMNFPAKMHQILDEEQNQECICWMPHGRCWRIFNVPGFEKNVLPKYFRSARYPSFMRQVNGWGFRRVNMGPDKNCYYHPCFLQGMPDLSEHMRRPQKGQYPLKWAQEYSSKHPDFYKIHAVVPLPATLFHEATPKEGAKSNDSSDGESSNSESHPSSGTPSIPRRRLTQVDLKYLQYQNKVLHHQIKMAKKFPVQYLRSIFC